MNINPSNKSVTTIDVLNRDHSPSRERTSETAAAVQINDTNRNAENDTNRNADPTFDNIQVNFRNFIDDEYGSFFIGED